MTDTPKKCNVDKRTQLPMASMSSSDTFPASELIAYVKANECGQPAAFKVTPAGYGGYACKEHGEQLRSKGFEVTELA